VHLKVENHSERQTDKSANVFIPYWKYLCTAWLITVFADVKKTIIKHKNLLIGLISLFILIISPMVFTGEDFSLSRDLLKKVEKQYGQEAVARLSSWEELIRKNKNLDDQQKLDRVNKFFNGMIFVNDIDLWGVNDYWATPVEFLSRGAGDCEDYAIAKYFTLKAMGMPDSKLNVAYVKALQYNMPHVVLTYYPKPGAEPLVLDNLIDTIEFSSNRDDLIPIYSFNGTGLWLAHRRGQGKLAGASSRIIPWHELMERMTKDKF
jgi:predicted transglutaminase-like cysteine proteinase